MTCGFKWYIGSIGIWISEVQSPTEGTRGTVKYPVPEEHLKICIGKRIGNLSSEETETKD